MSSTMHWPYLGVIIVQKIPSESLQYNSTTVFMTCNEMAATVSCRHGSHTQVSTLPYPLTGQSPCICMVLHTSSTGERSAATTSAQPVLTHGAVTGVRQSPSREHSGSFTLQHLSNFTSPTQETAWQLYPKSLIVSP